MKVNNIIIKGMLVVSAASLTACSDFLEEKNWSSQSAEEYYETATGRGHKTKRIFKREPENGGRT